MSSEYKERLHTNPTLIEFCGTPFKARDKYLVSNSIEDMVAERLGTKIDTRNGIQPTAWPYSKYGYYKHTFSDQLARVQRIYSDHYGKERMELVLDGAFSAMVFTRFYEQAHEISREHADSAIEGLKVWAYESYPVLLTLIKPRAALVREIGFDAMGEEVRSELIENKKIFFEVFNQLARKVAVEDWPRKDNLYIFDYSGDTFDRNNIFFDNAETVFKLLNLPTISEWDEILKENPELKSVRHSSISGYTMAGLTTPEIIENLKEWDWSINPEKRRQVSAVTKKTIGIVGNVLDELSE